MSEDKDGRLTDFLPANSTTMRESFCGIQCGIDDTHDGRGNQSIEAGPRDFGFPGEQLQEIGESQSLPDAQVVRNGLSFGGGDKFGR